MSNDCSPSVIRFYCPGCRKRYTVPASKGGKRSTCGRCGQRLRIPLAVPPAGPANQRRLVDELITVCTRCGTTFGVVANVVGSAVVCPQCGAPGPDAPISAKPELPSQSHATGTDSQTFERPWWQDLLPPQSRNPLGAVDDGVKSSGVPPMPAAHSHCGEDPARDAALPPPKEWNPKQISGGFKPYWVLILAVLFGGFCLTCLVPWPSDYQRGYNYGKRLRDSGAYYSDAELVEKSASDRMLPHSKDEAVQFLLGMESGYHGNSH